MMAHWRLLVLLIVAGFVSGVAVEIAGERWPDAGAVVHYPIGVGVAVIIGLLTAWGLSLIKSGE